MDGTKKTKAQLIANLEAANSRLAALENKPERERRKNRQLRIFVDALPNFGFAFDGDGRILQVLTGGRPSASRELEGRLLEKILPGEDAAELQKRLVRTFDTGEAQVFSLIMAPLAGRRWFKARTSLRKNSDSGGKFVVLLSQEITNEKLAESIFDGKQPNPRQDQAALPGQPDGLGDFSEFPNDSLFIIDAQTLRSMYFSGVGATPTGAGPEKVLQEIADKINQPGFAPGIKRDIHRLLRPEGSAPERETGPKAGRKALPALRARIVKTDGQQTVIGLVGALAERARGEEALRESETRNRTIFETARDSIISIDDQGKIESFNPSSEQIFGYRAEEVVGRDVSLLMPENFAHQHKKGLQNFLHGGQPRIIGNNVEVQGKRKDGTLIPLEITIGEARTADCRKFIGVLRDITRRKQAEQALLQSEEKYRTLIESTHQGILVHRKFQIQFANRSVAKLLGYQGVEELIGMDLRDLHRSEDRAFVRRQYAKILEGEFPSQFFEHRLIRKDRSEIWSKLTAIKVDWEGGPAVLDVIEDISEQKAAEETLRKLSHAVEQSPATVVITNTDGEIEYVNPKFTETTGYSAEEVIGKNPRILKSGHTPPEEYDQLWRTIGSGAEWRGEFRNKRKDGTLYWEAASISAIKGPDGKITNFIAVKEDITERKLAEEALQESEERFRVALMNSPITVHTQDRDLRYTWIFNEDSDYTLESALGKRDEDFLSPENARELTEFKKEIINSGVGGRREFSFHLPTGIATYDVTCEPLRDSQDNIVGITGAATNISEQKQLEAQFQLAQKMEAVGTLAGGIAHNFNNLLHVISLKISLLLLGTDSSHPHYEILTAVYNNVKSGSELTKQLLGFARGGKYEVKPSDLNRILADLSKMFARTHKGITIQKKYDKSLSTTNVDQGQIEQVLLNLLVNAWQAMPGGGQITIKSENATLDDTDAKLHSVAPGRYVKVSVTDTGTGMDGETKKRIFEPFFSTKGMSEGTGLGLASAYGIIKNHGGFITVASEVGRGTTFDIFLPATNEEIPKVKKSPKVETPKGMGTILFVDDDRDLVETERHLLQLLGFDVLVAGSGNEALEVYEENKGTVDLVILDMTMPRMAGGDVFDKLKELDPAAKVLLSSGYSIDGQAMEIMERGCDGFIQKPYKMETLSKKILAVLNRE